MSALRHYNLDALSVERLMVFLTALGRDVEIRIKAHRTPNTPGRLQVEAA